jgi:hypothetical protein
MRGVFIILSYNKGFENTCTMDQKRMHTSNVLRNNLFSHKTKAYLDQFKIMKSIPRKCIGQNDKKTENNVGHCPPYIRTILAKTGKSLLLLVKMFIEFFKNKRYKYLHKDIC